MTTVCYDKPNAEKKRVVSICELVWYTPSVMWNYDQTT